MQFISADKFTNQILKKIALGDHSVFLGATNDDFNEVGSRSIFSIPWNPLSLACNNGHVSIVDRLLQIPCVAANAAVHENRALIAAAENGHITIVNRLLEIPSVTTNAAALDNQALISAAEHGHIDVINRLLKIPSVAANAAACNNLALIFSAKNGYLQTADKLLEIISVTENAAIRDNYALSLAAENGHIDIVKRLLKISSVAANISARNNYALVSSIENDHLEISYILASLQWPRGSIDIPGYLQGCLPAIYQGAQIASGKKEFEEIVKCWIRGMPANTTNNIHYPGHDTSSRYLVRIDEYNAPRTIMQYAGCRNIVSEAKNEKNVNSGMNTLLYSSNLHRIFQNAYENGQKENKESSGYGEEAITIYKPRKHIKTGI
ncbi:MAG: ankyrin repeat domain-containing protein [Francisellaceae bacterium]|jgi:hypothetical protein|nr:ankyrin repeat domain-containing protein [Francisellaceae bacterium]MBT6208101.1 ankyrin repeat domain-containing protein [Francisellaceae bacterium]MBT6538980.1 ankyrin repeat domain-containing protein [Francisellaceae bacterium]